MAGLETDDRGDRVTMRIHTEKPFEVFKEDTERELQATWASAFLRKRWSAKVCHINTPGVFSGELSLENQLIQSKVKLGAWLPSWWRTKIINDIQRSMKIVSQYSREQEEAQDSREGIRNAAHETRQEARIHEIMADEVVEKWQLLDEIAKVSVAISTGTGSSVSLAGALGTLEVDQTLWSTVALLGALLAVVQATLRVSEKLKTWNEIRSELNRLSIDLKTFQYHMDIDPKFPIEEYRGELDKYRSRYAAASARLPSDLLRTRAMEERIRRRVKTE